MIPNWLFGEELRVIFITINCTVFADALFTTQDVCNCVVNVQRIAPAQDCEVLQAKNLVADLPLVSGTDVIGASRSLYF